MHLIMLNHSIKTYYVKYVEKAMAPHSSTLAWNIPCVPLHRQSPWRAAQVQAGVGQRDALRGRLRWHQPR